MMRSMLLMLCLTSACYARRMQSSSLELYAPEQKTEDNSCGSLTNLLLALNPTSARASSARTASAKLNIERRQPVSHQSMPFASSSTLKGAVNSNRLAPPQMLGVTEAGIGILASTGALAWLFPEVNLPGFKGYDSTTQALVRAIGAWQLCYASVLAVGKRAFAPATLSGFSLFAAATTIVTILPVWDSLGREKPSQVAVAAIFALLGKLTLSGVVSPFVAALAYLLPGGLIYATPQSTAELYKLSSLPLSGLASSMLTLYGASIGFVGVYIAGCAAGFAHPISLAAALLANAIVSLRWAVTQTSKLGTPKAGPVAWSTISAVLAGMAVRAA